MKKLKIIFIVCVAACIASCSYDGCTGEPPDSDYAWANESGVDVKMIVVKNYLNESKFIYEKIIADGDTLHGYDYTNKGWYPYPYKTHTEIIKVKLVFLDELEKCLIFDGEIEDSFDIRNLYPYEAKRVEKFRSLYEYTYTITPEHREMAKEEDCLSDSL